MTSRRYQQTKREQLRDAERAGQIASRRMIEADNAFEAVAAAYDRGEATADAYFAAREMRDVAAQAKRVADDWTMRCEGIVDEMLEAVR
jgi:hypothetical protein